MELQNTISLGFMVIIGSLLVQLSSGFSFGALFGNKFIFGNQQYTTRPNEAYALRKPYAEQFGPHGENYIKEIGHTPHYFKPPEKSAFVLPVFAPFGTEGFTQTPEQKATKKRRDYQKKQRERRQRGHRP